MQMLIGSLILASVISMSPGQAESPADKQLREHPGGVKVSERTVEYKGGAMRVIFGTAEKIRAENERLARSGQNSIAIQSTPYIHDCPSGSFTKWFCFYSNDKWNEETPGRMLEFKDGGLQSLANYGFDNETTSWVNTTGRKVDVFDSTSGSGRLWTMSAGGSSSNVGRNLNDRASSFRS